MIRAVVSATVPIGLEPLGLSGTRTLHEAFEVLHQLSCQFVDGGYMYMYIA